MSNMVDLHMHLADFKQRKELLDKISAHKQYTLCMSNSPEEYVDLLKCKYQDKYLKLALGFHPQYSTVMKFNSLLFMKNISTTQYIGEIGLDFSKQYIGKKEEQKKIFEFICDVASRNNKLLSIHCVQAEDDLFHIMEKAKVSYAILHWYSGKIERISNFINKGYYFSINSKMINSNKFDEIICKIPSNRILVESDAPYTIKSEKQYFEAIGLTYKKLNEYGITHQMVFNNLRNLLSEIQL